MIHPIDSSNENYLLVEKIVNLHFEFCSLYLMEIKQERKEKI